MSASASTGNAQRAARKLGDLLAAVEVTGDWSDIEANAQDLANELRHRGGPGERPIVLPPNFTLTSIASIS